MGIEESLVVIGGHWSLVVIGSFFVIRSLGVIGSFFVISSLVVIGDWWFLGNFF